MRRLWVAALVSVLCLAFGLPAMAKVTVGGIIITDFYYFDEHEPPFGGHGFEETGIDMPWIWNRRNSAYTRDDGSIIGHIQLRSGFGPIYGGGFRADMKFDDTLRMERALYDPDMTRYWIPLEKTLILPESTPVGPRERSIFPRLDFALPVTMGSGVVKPAFTYLRQDFDEVVADDRVDIWGLSLGIKADSGPLTFSGEIAYGENLGGGDYVGGLLPALAYDSNNDSVLDKIADAEVVGWWINVGFKFGLATLHGIFGSLNVQNDVNPINPNDNWDVTTYAYGLTLPITVTKGFTVRPELMFYDLDDDSRLGTGSPIDLGKATIVGLQFQLAF